MTNICVKRFSAVVKNICNAVAPLAAYVLQFAILQTKTFQLAKMYASNLKFLIFKTNLARVFPFRFKFFIMFLNYLIIFVNFVDKKKKQLHYLRGHFGSHELLARQGLHFQGEYHSRRCFADYAAQGAAQPDRRGRPRGPSIIGESKIILRLRRAGSGPCSTYAKPEMILNIKSE